MTVAEPLDDLLERASATEGVFTCITADRALAEETAVEARLRQGMPPRLLEGVRLSWKDLFDLAGTPTTCGSLVVPHDLRRRDAEAVIRLSAAGAVCVGKTNLSEFAFSGLGVNPHFRTPRNPALPIGDERVCGGSSCGAAAAVALGLCDIAVGTDTSGSVRVPASFTGLIGFRASTARYPMTGLWTLSPSMDTIGLLARKLGVIVRADAVLAMSVPPFPGSGEDTPQFIFDTSGLSSSEVAPAVRAAMARFGDRLRNAGHMVRWEDHRHLQGVRELFAQHGTLVAHEALQTLGSWLEPATVGRIDPRIRERLQQARDTLDPTAAPKLHNARRKLIEQLALQTPPNAVFVSPTTPTTAPSLVEATQAETFHTINRIALSITMPCSFLDMPGLALPSGTDDRGAPTSVLLSVPQGRDSFLLQVGCMIEREGLLEDTVTP